MRKVLVVLTCTLLCGCGMIDRAPTCDVSQLTTNMTVEQVMLACGKPTKINADSYNEQWVYDHNSYIYIRGGHFSSAQWVKYP